MKKVVLAITLILAAVVACSAPEGKGADSWGEWEPYSEIPCSPQILINNQEGAAGFLSQKYLGVGFAHIADGYIITEIEQINGSYYPITEPVDHPIAVFGIMYATDSGTMDGLEAAPYDLVVGGEVMDILSSHGTPQTAIIDDEKLDAWQDYFVFHAPDTFTGTLEYGDLRLNVPAAAAARLQLPLDCK